MDDDNDDGETYFVMTPELLYLACACGLLWLVALCFLLWALWGVAT